MRLLLHNFKTLVNIICFIIKASGQIIGGNASAYRVIDILSSTTNRSSVLVLGTCPLWAIASNCNVIYIYILQKKRSQRILLEPILIENACHKNRLVNTNIPGFWNIINTPAIGGLNALQSNWFFEWIKANTRAHLTSYNRSILLVESIFCSPPLWRHLLHNLYFRSGLWAGLSTSCKVSSRVYVVAYVHILFF